MQYKKYVLIIIGIFIVSFLGSYLLTGTDPYHFMKGLWSPAQTTSVDSMSDSDANHAEHETSAAVGITERAFLEHMIPHHQEAIDTANQVLLRSEHPEVVALAKSIIAAQEKELSDMKAWYQTWYGQPYQNSNAYEPMMRDLSSLRGSDVDRAFLEDMIEHHMEALTTNQQVVPNIEHTQIKTLTANIASSQSEEIITMRILLKQM